LPIWERFAPPRLSVVSLETRPARPDETEGFPVTGAKRGPVHTHPAEPIFPTAQAPTRRTATQPLNSSC